MQAALSLAAGVSHDFNNLLTVLVGNLYLISELVRMDPVVHEKVRKACNTAKRGAEFTRQLLDLARGADAGADATAVNPERVVESLSPLLGAVLGSRIELQTTIAAAVPAVFVNRAQLESVVTNLVINARDAFGEGQPGTITLSVSKQEISAPTAAALGLKAGHYVEIAVADDGCGIPPELAQRVFEPFFSTKAKGKTSGLGLPMVRWFAGQAGGTASLKSLPGEGTVVTVLLPAHHADAAETGNLTIPISSLPSGNENVAVFSEDGDFRSTIEQILATLGYRLVSESDAIQRGALTGSPRSVLVIDAHKLSAAAFRRADALMRRLGTAVGVVVIGDSRTNWPITPVRVPKPFTLAELAQAVRAAAEGV
ncbi:MAG: ATP-binding protein [Gammaproteobacteria bacterium]